MRMRRSLFIGIGALVLSTVAIQASDVLQNIDGGLAGSVIESHSPCGEGAVQLNLTDGALCVDIYENSPTGDCAVSSPYSAQSTQLAIQTSSCASQSIPEVLPWTHVSLTDAQQLCARSGKRLPTASEWYDVALSVADMHDCRTDASGPLPSGAAGCVNMAGIHDLVGNVWEWVDAEVVDGSYNGRTVPDRGYVASVDVDGVVVTTTSNAQAEFGDDYAITNLSGVFGMIRGGYFDSGTDAGIFAQNLAVPINLKTEGIGFRCVKSL